MGEQSGIQWTDHTANAWMGCTHVGPGCDYCYAETLMDTRYGRVKWGAGQSRVMTTDKTWLQYRKWQARAAETGVKERVFCGSLMDWCDLERPEDGLERIHKAWRETPDLIWLMLTKRVGNIERSLPADWGDGYPNVMLMATVVNQKEADRDMPTFLRIPARWHGVSCEPMLGPVDFIPYLGGRAYKCKCEKAWHHTENNRLIPQGDKMLCSGCRTYADIFPTIDQIIVGGESGGKARPMHPDWARLVRDQCQETDTAFFFKQWGGWGPGTRPGSKARFWDTSSPVFKLGKKDAGRELDGRIWDEMPK